jgi:polyhydroxyalkanoate synthase
MHSFYLRTLYIGNQLAQGGMELAGQHLSLQDIKSDTYVVGAVNDHIVPWQASYKATRLLGGTVKYVLTNGGHVAGIVNPPGPKARYEVARKNRPTAAEWRATAESRAGSWWEDWTEWAGKRAGELGQPPPMGSRHNPVLGDAPGDYVHG